MPRVPRWEPDHARSGLPRRVLMTADTVGGVWTYAMELARGLHGEGVEVVLATMGAPLRADQWAEAHDIPSLRVEESEFKLEWMDAAEADVRAAGAWLLQLERRYEPDLIHLNGYAHAALPWLAPKLAVAHSCVHTWWQAVRRERAPRGFAPYTRAVRAGLAAADCVVAPTTAFLQALRAAHRSIAPSAVIPNGRDAERFGPKRKSRYFLTVGRLWDEAKNVQTLTRIAPQLRWPVRVVGDAVSPDGRAVDLPNVECLGRCPERAVADLMAHAPIYVHPARYEPFGLSVLEAALSGCALVLGDIGSLRELWGDAARYVPPDDADALARTLRTLAADPAEQRDLGRRARRRAETFTTAAMTTRYLHVYQLLVLARFATTARPLTAFA